MAEPAVAHCNFYQPLNDLDIIQAQVVIPIPINVQNIPIAIPQVVPLIVPVQPQNPNPNQGPVIQPNGIPSVQLPNIIPHFKQYSLNICGLISSKVEKRDWIKQKFKNKKVGVIHFQETHFNTRDEALAFFMGLGGYTLGFSAADNRSAGVITWIPQDSPIYGIIKEQDKDLEGRWAVLKVQSQQETLYLANVYAPSDSVASREEFYSELEPKIKYPNLILGGDHNFVSDSIDRLGLDGPHTSYPHHPRAEEALENLELEDLYRFYNEEETAITFRHRNHSFFARLDRFYVCSNLTQDCQPLQTICAATVSDHDAIGMSYKLDIPRDKIEEPHFRMSRAFLKAVANVNSDLHKTVIEIIDTTAELLRQYIQNGDDHPAHKVWDEFKVIIKKLFQSEDSKHKDRMNTKVKHMLETVNFEFPVDCSKEEYNEILCAKNEAIEALRTEEQMILQNIRAASEFNWLRASEHSNKLFFQYTKARIKQNRIPELVKPEGNLTNSLEEKKQVASNAYAETFSKRLPDPSALQKVMDALDQSGNKLDKKNIDEINKFTDFENLEPEWVLKTIESLKMYKAPGPDGIPNDFYYIFRNNSNLIFMLHEVFRTSVELGELPSSMRQTYYKLLYKKGFFSEEDLKAGVLDGTAKDPRNFSNWRPIALLPCDSKIFSAYLANQLKYQVDKIISKSQSAFIPGRSIHDNIMLVQQMIHYHNSLNIPAGLVFVDFAHAYDYISQEYILEVMIKLDFPLKFVSIVKMLMNKQTGRVLVNGDLSPEFNVDNGGKQGDPLFPLIYIIALEGFNALLNTHPDYKGVLSPAPDGDTFIKHSGYCDDCCVAVSNNPVEWAAIADILTTFEKASGNEVKKAKSYIIWLGTMRKSLQEIFGIKPLIGSERYLGIQIAEEFDPALNWSKLLSKFPTQTPYWSTMGLSIFGRSLMINSSLLSQIWFMAVHTPPDKKSIDMLNKHVNNYFRKGKRANSVSYAKRITPSHMGGLGQLDIKKQIDNLLSKWIIRSLANDPHPWNIYWKFNTDQLQAHLKTNTHPLVLDINWKGKSSPPHLFHLIMPAYQAWHAINLDAKISTFCSVSPMPLFRNKFITQNGDSIIPSRNCTRVLNTINTEGLDLTIGSLYEEIIPTPNTPFEYTQGNTWRYKIRTPARLNTFFNVDRSNNQWNEVLSKIPQYVDEIMTAGEPIISNGWGATVMALNNEIGDIYYVYQDQKENMTYLLYFEIVENDQIKFICDSINEDWGNWEIDILPNLRPLHVSAISGHPVIIGWANHSITNSNFYTPEECQKFVKSVESSVSSAFYNKMKDNRFQRPTFNTLFKQVRLSGVKPIAFLKNWIPPANSDSINWKKVFKNLRNCTFLVPKYKQLIYWILTGSIMDGYRLNLIKNDKGICPFCQTGANAKHMFSTCPNTNTFWNKVNTLGTEHWGDQYKKFQYNDIIYILDEYDPIKLFHISALWAIWRTWCCFFYEDQTPEFVANWQQKLIKEFQDQFVKRIAEAPATVQWVALAQDRRNDPNLNNKNIPEKEFLLIHTQSISTSKKYLPMVEGELHHLIKLWIGKSILVEVKDLSFHRPRLRINFGAWTGILDPVPVNNIPINIPTWRSDLPQSVGFGN